MLSIAPAVAQQVGTATAVNPMSESTPPGGTTAPLIVGAHIIHNERIHTTPNGTVQLRFTDNSSMSIAPNTDIVINDYVYDPNAQHGHMLVTLTQGALRYVGGQLSHDGEAMITTSAATIGIRGGTATIIKNSKGTEAINHFGTITLHNGGGDFLLLRSDFGALAHDWHTLAIDLGRIPQTEIAYYLALLTSKGNQNGGVGLKTANIGHCGLARCPARIARRPRGHRPILANSTAIKFFKTPPVLAPFRSCRLAPAIVEASGQSGPDQADARHKQQRHHGALIAAIGKAAVENAPHHAPAIVAGSAIAASRATCHVNRPEAA